MSGARHPAASEALAAYLSETGGLKLWSVIVTVLGDLLDGGEAMPGPVLTALVAGMGLQPQAMRVALHRLGRDGWTEVARAGRVGHYRLSAMGRAETAAVGARVYGPAPEVPDGLRIALLPPEAEVPSGLVSLPLTRRAVLVGAGDLPSSWLVAELCGVTRTGWAEAPIAEAARVADHAALAAQLAPILAGRLPEGVLDCAVLRVLVLHGWRRLILRTNPLAEALVGRQAGPGRCRGIVRELLTALPRPDPGALGSALG